MGAPGPLLGPPEATLGEVWGVLGPPLALPGALFGRSWPLLGDSCEGAGSLLGALGWLRGAREGPKSLPGGSQEPPGTLFGVILAPSWDDLGSNLGAT